VLSSAATVALKSKQQQQPEKLLPMLATNNQQQWQLPFKAYFVGQHMATILAIGNIHLHLPPTPLLSSSGIPLPDIANLYATH